ERRIAWTITGQARSDQGDYAKAEPASLQARELAGKDDKMRADLTERLAASVYKEGEAKQKAGDGGGAVEDFLRVGRVAPESKIRANAQYDAAAELLTLKEWERAIGVLQDFRRQFPQHQLQPEVARKLAVAYSEANRPGEAAAEFERIASNPAESRSVQREALMQSADLYSKAGNNPRAMGMLEKFVDTNPTPLADAEEARQRLADYAGKSGDGGRRDPWEQAIKAHELNAARAKDGVYDEWVRKSFQALAQLKPARYGKTELTQDVVTSLE